MKKKAPYLKQELYNLIQSDISIFEFIQEDSIDGLRYSNLENPENEWINERFWEVLGYDSKTIKNQYSRWQNIIFEEDLKILKDTLNKHLENEQNTFEQIIRAKHKKGHTLWIKSRSYIIRNKNANPIRMIGVYTDITDKQISVQKSNELLNLKQSNNNINEKYKCEQKLRIETEKNNREIERYINLVDKYIIISSTNLKGIITQASEAFCNVSGYKESELLGKSHNIVRHYDTPKEIFKELWETIKNDKTWNGELKNLKKDGSLYWVESTISPKYNDEGIKVGYTSIRTDITSKKKAEELSITDSLTKVYNRRYFNMIFESILNRSKRDKKVLSFLMLDIDYFKQYNDFYGHNKGDETLYAVAQKIKHIIRRADDYCFRLGGEEFGITLESASKEESIKIADKIREEIEKLKISHNRSDISEFLTVSIGIISIKYNEDISINDIYKDADILLYKAKKNGRNRIEY